MGQEYPQKMNAQLFWGQLDTMVTFQRHGRIWREVVNAILRDCQLWNRPLSFNVNMKASRTMPGTRL